MQTDSDTRSDTVLESIRIAVVQIPFIPVINHQDLNLLAEPEGGMNYALFGQEQRQLPHFSDLPIPMEYKDKILNSFLKDYQDWLLSTIKQILEIICTHEVDFIVFPEYSLPLEINPDLRDVLSRYSQNRCIVEDRFHLLN